MYQLSASSSLLWHPQAMRQKWAEFLTLSHGQSPRAYLPQVMEAAPFPRTKYTTSLGGTSLRYEKPRDSRHILTLSTQASLSHESTPSPTLSGYLRCIRSTDWHDLRQRYYISCTPWAGLPLGQSGSTIVLHLLTSKMVSSVFV